MPRPRSLTTQRDRTQNFAMVMPQEHIARASSASARPLSEFTFEGTHDLEWQSTAFTMNEVIGEIGYLHNLVANLVASCEIRVVQDQVGSDGLVAEESGDPRAMRVMAAFTGPVGGVKELKRRAALHYQIAGESHLLGSPLKSPIGDSYGFSWEFLSTRELKVSGSGRQRKAVRSSRGLGTKDEVALDSSSFIARFHRPDPQYSKRADSPMKRILPLCRELIVLSEVVEGVARSRLAAGMLFVPEEMSFGPLNENEDEDNSDDEDPFVETLVDHMSAPVEDRTSAAGLVPLVVRGPADLGEKIKLIALAQDLDGAFQELRVELLTRIGRALDAPPEVMTGKAGLNHWSSFAVDAELVSKHVNPIGEALAEFLTTAYLRPMLIAFENVPPAEALSFRLAFDYRPISARADEGPAATNAWDRLALGDIAYIRANGFEPEDMPTEEERQRRMLEKVLASDPSNYAPIILPLLYPDDPKIASAFARMTPRIGTVAGDGPGVQAPIPVDRGAGAAPPEEEPVNPPTGEPPTQAASSAEPMDIKLLIDRLTTAADAALERALERCANRVFSRVNGKNPRMRDALRSMPKMSVMSSLTDGDLLLLGTSRAEILDSVWDGFTERGRAWTRDWLLAQGLSSFEADSVAVATMKRIEVELDEWFSTVGSKVPPTFGPNGFRVPTEVISAPMRESLSCVEPLASLVAAIG